MPSLSKKAICASPFFRIIEALPKLSLDKIIESTGASIDLGILDKVKIESLIVQLPLSVPSEKVFLLLWLKRREKEFESATLFEKLAVSIFSISHFSGVGDF